MKAGAALVIALVWLTALAPRASAAGGVRVVVDGAGGAFVSGADLLGNIDVAGGQAATVTLRDAAGGTSTVDATGTSIQRVLTLAHIPATAVSQVDVLGASNAAGVVTISGPEVIDGFTGDPGGPPARKASIHGGSATGNDVVFIRPLRDTTPPDVNNRDVVTAANGGDLRLNVRTNSATHLTVTAQASDTTPDPGAPVSLTAAVSGAPAGWTVRYSWDFGDGTTADNQPASTAIHQFGAGPKQVSVSVLATSPDETAVASGIASVTLQVGTVAGTPPPATTQAPATPGPTTGAGNGGAGAAGGARTGGGTGNARDRTSGPKKSAGTGEKRRTGARTSSPARTTQSTTAAPKRAATPPRTPASASTSGAGSTGSTGSTASTASTGAASSTPSSPSEQPTARANSSTDRTPAPKHAAAAAPRDGEQVQGILLASAGAPADALAAATSASKNEERSQARRGGGRDTTIAGWAGGTGLLVALLALGALRESRLRWRLRLP